MRGQGGNVRVVNLFCYISKHTHIKHYPTPNNTTKSHHTRIKCVGFPPPSVSSRKEHARLDAKLKTQISGRNKPREKLVALQNFYFFKNEPSISFVHVVLRILCVFDDKECGSHVMFWKAQKSFRGIRRVRLNYFFDSSHTH